ncbi:hypothetical protein E4U21_004100 [Claviceps maximensis]|nr:hypothetical protein E4U21_004100 [Claviceps maximensis]
MRVSVSSALLFAAAAMAAPANTDKEPQTHSCTRQSSQTKEWHVKDLDFHASYLFTTPAHQVSAGDISFTLENPSLKFTSHCHANSNHLNDFFYGDFVYNCTQPMPNAETTFTFSRPSGQLMINQTWICAKEGSRFWAKGGANLTLSCKDDTWHNPEWKMGQTYSSRTVTCDHLNANVPVSSMAGVA